MEDNKATTPQSPAAGYPTPYGYDPREDEINLAELWDVLVKRKMVVLSISAVLTIAAVLYSLLATPVYRAEAVFLPPATSDIEALNIQGLQKFNISRVYKMFERNLSSRPPRQAIYDQMNLLDQFEPDRDEDTNLDVIFDEFNQGLSITTPKVKKGETLIPIPTITFAMEWEDPVLTAEIVNRIADEAEQATKKEILLNIKTQADARVLELNQEIERLHEITIKRRQDEIERLETADALERNNINDKIASLQNKALNDRLAEISRLEEADRIEREAVEEKISTLRNSAKAKRLDRVAVLKEASGIAHSLDIKDPIGYKLKKISDSALIKSQILTSISNSAPQLYTRGYEAIDAEITSLSNRTIDDPFIPELRGLQDRLKLLQHNEKIAALKARMDDDPFIPELRGLQEKLKLLEHNRKVEQLKSRQNDDPFITALRDKENELVRLESIHIDPETVKTARLDQAAFPPDKRIKPKRKLIVMLGLMLGLMLGVFVAFFVNFIETQKKKPVTP